MIDKELVRAQDICLIAESGGKGWRQRQERAASGGVFARIARLSTICNQYKLPAYAAGDGREASGDPLVDRVNGEHRLTHQVCPTSFITVLEKADPIERSQYHHLFL